MYAYRTVAFDVSLSAEERKLVEQLLSDAKCKFEVLAEAILHVRVKIKLAERTHATDS